MRLLSQYNRLLIFISLGGVIIIGILFYETLSYHLNSQLDDQLEEELLEVRDYTHVKNVIPDPSLFDDLVIEYTPARSFSKFRSVGDTVFYNPKKKEQQAGRYLRTIVDFNGKPYQVLIIISKLQRLEQIRSVFLIIIIPVVFLFLILFLVNKIVIGKLWSPFYRLLENIKTFNVNQETAYSMIDTPIQEFRELNEAIAEMSQKVKSDYREIKLFTENASHEMMTPLAIINSKLDTILQSRHLGKDETDILSDLYKATSRLTKLNQSLLLLVKIDNNEMSDLEIVDVRELVEEKLVYFGELIQNRELEVRSIVVPLKISASRYLFEILINNLFTNAIRHNQKGGLIEIKMTSDSITVRNTSDNKILDENRVFERFYKDPSSEGTGLGLSILKQICIRMGYSLKYNYIDKMHSFTIGFRTTNDS